MAGPLFGLIRVFVFETKLGFVGLGWGGTHAPNKTLIRVLGRCINREKKTLLGFGQVI